MRDRFLTPQRVGFRFLLLCSALAVSVPSALTQGPDAPPEQARQGQRAQGQGQGQGAQGQQRPSQQSTQGWATEKLDNSPRLNQWVKVPSGDRSIKAWVDYPEGDKKVPVVLVLHEVFGLTDSTRNTADQIAAMGYITISPDMLSGRGPNGGGTESIVGNVGDKMTSFTDDQINADLTALADYAAKLPRSNGKLAIVGLSWGGGAAFRFAADVQRKDLKLVCVFYDVGPPTVTQGPNRLAKDNPPISVAKISVPIYGFYGATDARPLATIQATKDAMAAAGKKYDPVVYDGADHAYMRVGEQPNANPANVAAVKASLERLQKVLGEGLK